MAQEGSKRVEEEEEEEEEKRRQPPSGGPVLCTNKCGFFGSASTMNLCSKCHEDFLLKHARETSAKGSAEKVSRPTPTSPKSNFSSVTLIEDSADSSPAACQSSKIGEASAMESNSKPATHQPHNRCFSCKARVGWTGFKCRCGNMFCTRHRFSDQHDCSYDYKAAGRDAIAQANPEVRPAKMKDKI